MQKTRVAAVPSLRSLCPIPLRSSAHPSASAPRLFSATVHASARPLTPLTLLVALEVPGDDDLATQAARPRLIMHIFDMLMQLNAPGKRFVTGPALIRRAAAITVRQALHGLGLWRRPRRDGDALCHLIHQRDDVGGVPLGPELEAPVREKLLYHRLDLQIANPAAQQREMLGAKLPTELPRMPVCPEGQPPPSFALRVAEFDSWQRGMAKKIQH